MDELETDDEREERREQDLAAQEAQEAQSAFELARELEQQEQVEAHELDAIQMADEVMEALESIANRNGFTVEQAIAQAIINEKLLEDLVDGGAQLLVKKGRTIRHLEYR